MHDYVSVGTALVLIGIMVLGAILVKTFWREGDSSDRFNQREDKRANSLNQGGKYGNRERFQDCKDYRR